MADLPVLPFDPRLSGAGRWLGPLSGRVMEFIWGRLYPVSNKTILHAMNAHGANHKYTTISTVTTRLFRMGLLLQERAFEDDGRTYAYRASITQEQFEDFQWEAIEASRDESTG